jgi:hypothetical protein
MIGNVPIDYQDCVTRADLTTDEADGAILESLERSRVHGARGSWRAGPSVRPADIGEHLLADTYLDKLEVVVDTLKRVASK